VGALSIVAADACQAGLVLDQIKVAIRTNYSTPPTHGALLVSTILTDPELRAQWEAELETMRQRIRRMREGLVARLAGNNSRDFSRLVRQNGLFSYSGLDAEQMARLREEFAIYGVSDGRFCMAALTERTLDRVAEGIREVSKRVLDRKEFGCMRRISPNDTFSLKRVGPRVGVELFQKSCSPAAGRPTLDENSFALIAKPVDTAPARRLP
jgi:hypothetical protein